MVSQVKHAAKVSEKHSWHLNMASITDAMMSITQTLAGISMVMQLQHKWHISLTAFQAEDTYQCTQMTFFLYFTLGIQKLD